MASIVFHRPKIVLDYVLRSVQLVGGGTISSRNMLFLPEYDRKCPEGTLYLPAMTGHQSGVAISDEHISSYVSELGFKPGQRVRLRIEVLDE